MDCANVLLFALKRLDVFSSKDAGLMRGVRVTYFGGILPGAEDLEKVTNRWKPYRTIGSWYMWQVANAQPSITSKPNRNAQFPNWTISLGNPIKNSIPFWVTLN